MIADLIASVTPEAVTKSLVLKKHGVITVSYKLMKMAMYS